MALNTLVLISYLLFFQLNAATTKIARPVVIIDGKDAKKLRNIVKKVRHCLCHVTWNQQNKFYW